MTMMTRMEFLATLRELGMNQRQFAEHAGINPTTAYHWGGAGGPFPKWVEMLLAAWLRNRELETAVKRLHEDNLIPFKQKE